MQLDLIQKIAIWVLPVLFAITVHEVAHGWVANKLGDQTAKIMGRLTLNPMKHIDWIGTVAIPLLLVYMGGFIFGWAKPVPISPRNFKHPRRDMALVAVAGPLSNLVMAILWALIAKLSLLLMIHVSPAARPLVLMGKAGIFINVILGVLNLIPIPPLDGGRVVSNLIPPKSAYYYDKIEPFGFIILLALLVTGALGFVLGPPVVGLSHLLMSLFGIP